MIERLCRKSFEAFTQALAKVGTQLGKQRLTGSINFGSEIRNDKIGRNDRL